MFVYFFDLSGFGISLNSLYAKLPLVQKLPVWILLFFILIFPFYS